MLNFKHNFKYRSYVPPPPPGKHMHTATRDFTKESVCLVNTVISLPNAKFNVIIQCQHGIWSIFSPLHSMLRSHQRLCQVIWYLFKGILMLLPQFLFPFALTKDVDRPNLFPTQSSPLHLFFFFKSIYLKHTKNIFLFFPPL